MNVIKLHENLCKIVENGKINQVLPNGYKCQNGNETPLIHMKWVMCLCVCVCLCFGIYVEYILE